MTTRHQTVLLQEAILGLNLRASGVYVDGTFGRGGHSQLILDHQPAVGRLIALDKDPAAVEFGEATFAKDTRFQMAHASFAALSDLSVELGIRGCVDGILLDLGVSSPQLDNPARGFSFMHDGPLDMRMDVTQGLSAASFINQADDVEMADIFKQYGEERYARRIARAIVAARTQGPITTTGSLAHIVKEAHPSWEKHKHPATRVFQAIRIHINQELQDLATCLAASMDVLAVGGRLVVISFHSLEDRLVKQFMRTSELGVQPPRGIPIRASDMRTSFKRVGRAVKPSAEEIRHNNRARSAVMRIGEKIA